MTTTSVRPILRPLESGDRLTRAEFERRYTAMPHIKKAELIEGEVYMPSPVRHTTHGQPHFHLITWLGAYCAATPGVDASDNATLRLDWRNEVQPDVLLRLAAEAGGHSRISEEGYVEGAPELVAEVASSSAALDLHAKKEIYGRSGVQEYLVWRTLDEQLDWFALREGEYVPLEPDAQGRLRSRVLPGLWLAVTALLAGDLALVLAELRQGVAADEHTTFVQRSSPESSTPTALARGAATSRNNLNTEDDFDGWW